MFLSIEGSFLEKILSGWHSSLLCYVIAPKIHFLDIPELSIHGVEILKNVRKTYMDVLYTHILHNYAGSDIPEVHAATRVGHLITLIASITVRIYCWL
jgi:hypothetical protein